MSIPYAEMPSALTMKNLCRKSEDQWLFLQSSVTLFATATTVLVMLFLLPMVIAAPVGMICGTTFWSGDTHAVEAWLQSALLGAVTSAGVLLAVCIIIRIFTRCQWGAPAFDSELQVDLSAEEIRKMVRSYLIDKAVDDQFVVDKSHKRQIAMVNKGKLADTYVEVSIIVLDEERCWIVFRGASKLRGMAVLLSSCFNDFGKSRKDVLKMMKIFKPYASLKKRKQANYRASKQAQPAVKMSEHALPPSLRKKQRYQPEGQDSDLRQLKACS